MKKLAISLTSLLLVFELFVHSFVVTAETISENQSTNISQQEEAPLQENNELETFSDTVGPQIDEANKALTQQNEENTVDVIPSQGAIEAESVDGTLILLAQNDHQIIQMGEEFTVLLKGSTGNTILELPEGITYDKDKNKKSDGTTNADIVEDKEKHTLTVTNLPSPEVENEVAFKLQLNAAKIGTYPLVLHNESKTVESEPLYISITKKNEEKLQQNKSIEFGKPTLDFGMETNVLDPTTKSITRTTFRYNNPLNPLNDGQIVIQLPADLDVISYSPASSFGSTVKSVVHDVENKTLTYKLADTISSGTQIDLQYTIAAGSTATTDVTTKIEATVSGKIAGVPTGDLTFSSEEISFDGMSNEEATAGDNSWRISPRSVQINPGESLANTNNVPVAQTQPYQNKHFSELKIKYTTNKPGIHASVFHLKGKVTLMPGVEVTPIITKISETEYEYNYGAVNGNLTKSIGVTGSDYSLPNDAVIGDTYTMKAEVYNGEAKISETDQKITVSAPQNTLMFLAESFPIATAPIVAENGVVGLRTRLSGATGGKIVDDASYIVEIPDKLKIKGLAPQINAGNGPVVAIVEYELNHSGNYIRLNPVTISPNRRYNFEDIEGVTSVKITMNKANGWGATNPARFEFENKGYLGGETFSIEARDIQYTDPDTGQIQTFPSQTVSYTVSSEAVENRVGVYDGVRQRVEAGGDFDTNIKKQGDTWQKTTRFATYRGELEKPYIFVILPEGIEVRANDNSIGSYVTTDVWYSYAPSFALPVAPYKMNNMQSEKLSDGRIIHYFQLPDSTIPSIGNMSMLLLNLQYTVQTAEAGEYDVETGIGSLTQDDLTLASNISGFTNGQLDSEIKTLLGSSVDSYYSKKQTVNINSSNNIQTNVQVKGSEDANWIDASSPTGIATTTPGKEVAYKIIVKNSGTNSIKNFELIDILPHLGDSLITSPGVPRGTEFDGLAATDSFSVSVNGEKNPNASLQYSSSKDPIRFDALGNAIGTDAWSSTRPTNVSSIKVNMTDGARIRPGDTLELTYVSIVPTDAPRNGEVAVNTVAYKGDTISGMVVAEPVTAKVKTTAPLTNLEIGGQIYVDLDKDGTKASDEPGLNKTTLELYQYDETKKEYVTTNHTVESSNNSTNTAGYFNFTGLKEGKYRVKVTLPSNSSWIEVGDNSVEVIDEDTAWVKYNGNIDLMIDSLGINPEKIMDLSIPVYRTISINGIVAFKNNSGQILTSSYGAGFTVNLRDASNKVIATAITKVDGSYTLEGIKGNASENYQLEFIKPDGSTLVFTSDNSTGSLPITLAPGIGVADGGLTDCFITDTDNPRGDISLVGGEGLNNSVNPTAAILTAEDDTTTTSISWAIKDAAGEVVYSKNTTSISTELVALLTDKKYGTYTLESTVKDFAGNTTVTTATFIIGVKPELQVTTNQLTYKTNDQITEADILAAIGSTVITTPVDQQTTISSDFALAVTDNKVAGTYTVKVYATSDIGLVSEPIEVQITIEDVSISVSYMADGTEYKKATETYTKRITKPTDPEKAGYEFEGWLKDDQSFWNFATDIAPDTNLTLTAKFKAVNNTIIFDVNDGDVASQPADIEALTDSQVDIDAVTEPVRAGYRFEGWYDGTIKVQGSIKMPAGGLTLKAKWSAENQTITFDVNGGDVTSKPGDIVKPTDTEIDFDTLIEPTKAGYVFTGWYDGTNKITGKVKMPAGGLALIAGWRAEGQVISFDVNGGDMTSKPADIEAETDSSIDIDAVAKPIRAGYAFEGWYNGKIKVQGTIKMPAAGLTLVAKWRAEKNTITFDVNGGDTAKPKDIEAITDSIVDIGAVTEPERAGYTFEGWYDGVTKVTGIIKMPAGGLDLVAKWHAEDQTITFDVNSGDVTTEPADIVQPTDTVIDFNKITVPIKTGYVFEGWYNGTNKITGKVKMPAGGLDLVAKWRAADQKVIFDINGGDPTSQPAAIKTQTDENVDIDAVADPIRAGYTFEGWYDGTTKVQGKIKMPATNVTLVAKWHAEDQTITFDINSGDIATEPADIIAPTDTVIDFDTITEPTKEGYIFEGWYDGKNKVAGEVKMPAGGFDLVAKWRGEEQPITFDINGGNPASKPENITAPTDSTFDIEGITAPSREGFKFVGWTLNDKQVSGTITVPIGGFTLIAEWTDLIEDGTWQLEAEDVRISLSEIKELSTNGQLEEKLRDLANVRIVDQTTQQKVELTEKITVDLSSIAFEVGTHSLGFSYTAPTYGATRTLLRGTVPTTAEANVALTIYEESVAESPSDGTTQAESNSEHAAKETISKDQKNLPKAGEQQTRWLWLAGAFLLLIGVFTLITKQQKNKTK